jgi:Cu+-exporting ATPase
VFDKTGTITAGRPVVTDLVAASGTDPRAVLSVAAALEAASEHPLASAVLERATADAVSYPAAAGFNAVEGKGVVGSVNGREAVVGNRPLLADRGIDIAPLADRLAALEAQGKTVLLVAADKQLLGLIAVQDQPKPTAATAMRHLRERGFSPVMLTGDNRATAEAVAGQVGITTVIAEVLPGDKADHVKSLQQHGKVAFVGDGINDAPALAQADLGVAMGSGTDIAMEAGGIVLVKNDLEDVGRALRLSQKTFARIKLNLFWAFIYNLAGIPLAAGVFAGLSWTLNPALAGLAMAFSSVSVVTSSLLLNKSRI